MNKKAIAAFAAGATLLAGFAMATPAFANFNDKGELVKEDALTTPQPGDSDAVVGARANLTTAYTNYETAKGKVDTDNSAITAYKAIGEQGKWSKDALKAQAEKDVKDATANKDKAQAYLDAAKDLAADEAALATAKTKVTAAEAHVKDVTAPKASANVAVAKLKDTEKPLKEAQTKLDEAFGKYDAAYVAYKSAQQDKADAEKALKDYTRNHENEALPTYHSEVARLTKAFNVADEAAKKAKKACGDAETDFNKAKSAFNDAFAKYAAAYEAALAAKADVSAFATPASLGHDFNSEYQPGEGFVPGAGASHAGKPGAAQPGKPGQAAGQAGANGAAGAKTEVENKNGKDKRGNTHTGTGVGVTLTALAATMLAGMGAAVRKARH